MSQMINILSYTTNGGLRRLAAAVVRYLARRARPLIGPTVAGRLLFSHKKDTWKLGRRKLYLLTLPSNL